MEQSADKRRNPRIRTHFETTYSSGRQDGSGILANISYSGALLTQTSVQPRLGSQVRVYVLLNEDFPFVVVGQVVRHVEDGFAIEYADLSPELRRLVDDAAAMVANPRHVPPRGQSQQS
ncbi:MAG TPA: PilZ domain-containing protein [Myxococcota bacterium]|nr:PilZ domain-containing protein [Myxococcota bacterium]